MPKYLFIRTSAAYPSADKGLVYCCNLNVCRSVNIGVLVKDTPGFTDSEDITGPVWDSIWVKFKVFGVLDGLNTEFWQSILCFFWAVLSYILVFRTFWECRVIIEMQLTWLRLLFTGLTLDRPNDFTLLTLLLWLSISKFPIWFHISMTLKAHLIATFIKIVTY